MSLILAINPGSTSTKFAVFKEKQCILEETLDHSVKDLEQFEIITDQFQFRKDLILNALSQAGVVTDEIAVIVGRGGLVKPIPSGIYEVNEDMKSDLRVGILGQHASNLGGLIADDIAAAIPGAKAYIVDPVVVDEFQDVSRITGHPELERLSIFHALNQKAVARIYADQLGKEYEELNLVIAHMGGGVSVGAHRKGQVIDVNNALNGDGPFSPERAGGLPAGQLVDLCFSGKYRQPEIKKMLTGKGGMVAYLGTNDFREVVKMIQGGDEKAKLILDAFAYQLSKEIGAMAAALQGDVNAILLTGGVAHNKSVTDLICAHVCSIAPVKVYPGEDEMQALAMSGLRVLQGKTKARVYTA